MTHSKVMLIISVLAATSALADSSPNATAKRTTPQEVIALVKSRGPAETVVQLDRSGAWFYSVLPGVATAQADWLEIAQALYPGTDAGGREELEDALSKALLKSPYAALPILRPLWWKAPGTLCTFGWDSDLPGGVEKFVQSLRKSLAPAPPASLAPLRSECLRGIESTLIEVKANQHP